MNLVDAIYVEWRSVDLSGPETSKLGFGNFDCVFDGVPQTSIAHPIVRLGQVF